jgi:hypothetical protein
MKGTQYLSDFLLLHRYSATVVVVVEVAFSSPPVFRHRFSRFSLLSFRDVVSSLPSLRHTPPRSSCLRRAPRSPAVRLLPSVSSVVASRRLLQVSLFHLASRPSPFAFDGVLTDPAALPVPSDPFTHATRATHRCLASALFPFSGWKETARQKKFGEKRGIDVASSDSE